MELDSKRRQKYILVNRLTLGKSGRVGKLEEQRAFVNSMIPDHVDVTIEYFNEFHHTYYDLCFVNKKFGLVVHAGL